MNHAGVQMHLTSGRTLKQGRAMEMGKLGKPYQDAVAECEVDAATINLLGLKDGDPVRVETDFGTVVVRIRSNKRSEPGVAFMPCGPYANMVLGSDTEESGMPVFKGVRCSLFPALGQPILKLEELLAGLTGSEE